MVRVIVPDAANAGRLARIAHIAFEGREAQWSADDFVELGGPPHAAMIVDRNFRDALLVMQMAADEAEILNFGVVPSARRRGLGRELLAAAGTLASELGMAALFLEVATDNTAARALYASAGYDIVGERKRYYRRPDGSRIDALIMSKRLALPETC